MKVLIACEFSGIVREAFRKRGHDAWSCDLLDSERPGNHIKDNVFKILTQEKWDILIAFPPCTHLAVSGARWFKEKRIDGRQQEAINFFLTLAMAPCELIAIENPIGIMSTEWRKPDQIVQPWMFGHGETKATCLWLKGLPKLIPTNIVVGRDNRVHREPPSKDRWKNRSRTYPGIAEAMGAQWGAKSRNRSAKGGF